MDTAPTQSARLAPPLPPDDLLKNVADGAEQVLLPSPLLHELWQAADAHSVNLTELEFKEILHRIGTKQNHGAPPGHHPTPSQTAAFYSALQLKDLALAQACALGHEAAWQHFLDRFRTPLTQAAIAITGSSSLGEDLAGSLYSELFGLTERDGHRRSPLASYSGRGSLMGWLRTTLAQRHVDHHRRTRRETPIEDEDFPATIPTPHPPTADLARIDHALTATLLTLSPEDRFLLASYFLDGRTLLELSRLLRVHEATVSRKLKHLTENLRKQLLKQLEAAGMNRRAAQEALGTDPRDLSINLRNLLQTSPPSTFSKQAGPASPGQT